MSVFVSSAAVALAFLVVGWTFKFVNEIRAKTTYATLFRNVAIAFLDEPDFNPVLKKFLIEMAGHIQNKKVGEKVGRNMGQKRMRRRDHKVLQILGDARENPTKEQIQFLSAVFFFIMALSFSTPRYGSALRKRLQGELADQDALANEGALAINAAHFAV